MSSKAADKLRWAGLLSLALWLISFGYFNLFGSSLQPISPLKVSFYAGCALFGAISSWAWAGLVVATGGLGRVRHVLLSVGTLLVLVLVAGTVGSLVYVRLFPIAIMVAGKPVPPSLLYALLNTWLVIGWVYLVYGGVLSAILSVSTAIDRERRLAAAHAAAQEARLSALRLQINPHFLFNTLNAVTELIAENRRAEAEKVVGRLSEFFRASLSAPAADYIPLEEEFDTAGAYLAIEETRFEGRLILDVDLPEPLRRALTPPLLLQPLVENAAKYAVAPSKRPVTVRIEAQARGEALVLTVADNGQADSQLTTRPGLGVGLRNVAARLDATYGGAASLETERTADGYTVTIEMPLRFASGA